MTPLGGWEGRTIEGTAGVPLEVRPRTEGSVPASAQTEMGGSEEIRERRDRESRLEAAMQRVEPGSPRHKQMCRTLLAARKVRRRLEREAGKG